MIGKVNAKTRGFIVALTIMIILLLGLAGGVAAVLRSTLTTAYVQSEAGELSERAKRFYQKQKAEDTLWQNVNFNDSSDSLFVQGDNALYTSDCFTVSVPFRTYNPKFSKRGENCYLKASLIEPRGKLTLGVLRPTSPVNLDEHPAVQFRRLNPDRYSEAQFVHPDFSDARFFEASDEATLLAANDTLLITLSLTEMVYAENKEVLSPKIYEIVGSLSTIE